MHAASSDSSRRLRRLEQILADAKVATVASSDGDTDPAETHVVVVPLDRIRRITAELQRAPDEDIDEIDAVAMRILLSDYSLTVSHLRAAARLAEQRVAAATVPIQRARSVVPAQPRPTSPTSKA